MSRKLYEGSYTFTPASRTILFASDITHLRQILVIQNLTRGVMVYNFADGTLGGTFDENTHTLTLLFDTTTHSAGDVFSVFFEPNEADVPEYATEITIQDLYNQLSFLLDRLEFGTQIDNTKRLKVSVSNGVIDTLTTVATLTNQAQIGGRDAQRQVEALQDVAFNQGILNNISF